MYERENSNPVRFSPRQDLGRVLSDFDMVRGRLRPPVERVAECFVMGRDSDKVLMKFVRAKFFGAW
jgi:hypothetical protein